MSGALFIGAVGLLLLAAGAQGAGVRIERLKNGEGSASANVAGAVIGVVAALFGGGILLLTLFGAWIGGLI